MPENEKTKAQLEAEKIAEAKASRIKQVQEIRAKRAELKNNIGKTYTDGEREAFIERLDENNIQTETGWLADDYFVVNFGNKFVHKSFKVDEFLNNFKLKGAV